MGTKWVWIIQIVAALTVWGCLSIDDHFEVLLMHSGLIGPHAIMTNVLLLLCCLVGLCGGDSGHLVGGKVLCIVGSYDAGEFQFISQNEERQMNQFVNFL